MKPTITNRDKYYLILGILIAFFIQVNYELIHEYITSPPNTTNVVWAGAQILILVGTAVAIYLFQRFAIVKND